MTDKEKLMKIKSLADKMSDTAFNMTTDASLLKKAMDEYHQFIINEYHKEEQIIKELQEEPVSEKKCMFTKDNYTDEDRKVLCEDCKEKCKYSKKEEPVNKQNLSNVERIGKECKEGPASKELEEAAKRYATEGDEISGLYIIDEEADAFEAGAKWQKEHLWKPADGDDLPEIDREVIALLDNGKVVFAHRPPEYWDGKDIVTGKVTRNYPKTYDKGGWNIPDVKYWLDVELPKEIEL